ncbi:MAG: VanW family protein [Dethiobacteria bacterium]|jgi:vancomycin resistance protein YoaR|nr:VanW family protein [Bacillota bacterium]
MLEKEVYEAVEKLARPREKLPRNAYFDRHTGEILPEIKGQIVDIHATVEKVIEAEPGTTVPLVWVTLDAEIPAAFYQSFKDIIGAYHTWIGGGSRSKNIVLGAQLINNCILAPGEVFSFNRTIGPVTLERGFEMAPVIVGGQVVPGVGGGLCQVSSTLYNAVLMAGLEVVERYPHSRPVYYVPKGRDATVSTYLDFKFRNSSDRFIMIKASGYAGRVEVQLLSN